LTLKTRIKPSARASILDSVGATKQGTLVNALTAHVAGFSSTAFLDKLSVKDYKFLDAISALFISGGY